MSKAARVKPQHRAGEMAQWAKGLATTLDDLSSLLRLYLQTHVHTSQIHTQTHRHTHKVKSQT